MKNIRGEAVLHYIFDIDICFSCRALSCALLTMTSTYWTTPSSYTGILTDPATYSFHFGKKKSISEFRQIYIDDIITDLVSKQRRLFLLTQKRSLRKIISSTMRFSPRSPQIIQTWQYINLLMDGTHYICFSWYVTCYLLYSMQNKNMTPVKY